MRKMGHLWRVGRLKLQTPNTKVQTPNTKHQAPEKLQAPSSKLEARAAVWSLELGISLVFGAWFLVFRFRDFSGGWCLGFGVSFSYGLLRIRRLSTKCLKIREQIRDVFRLQAFQQAIRHYRKSGVAPSPDVAVRDALVFRARLAQHDRVGVLR